MADLGLSDSEEDVPPAPAAPAPDDLGLSDSEEEDVALPPIVRVDDGLGLSDSDDDGAPGAPSAPRARTPDSDSEEDAAPAPAELVMPHESTKAKAREPRAYEFFIPALPRPRPGTLTYVTKIPAQLKAETEEFSATSTLAELEERADELETGKRQGGSAQLERALAEMEAARSFMERSSENEHHMLWRYCRDDDGNVVRDGSGMAVRESNTRLVKWSDGSMQLCVGSDTYDVTTLRSDHGFIYAKQANLTDGSGKQQTVLESHGRVEGRLNLHLAGSDNAALLKLKSMSQQHSTKSSR